MTNTNISGIDTKLSPAKYKTPKKNKQWRNPKAKRSKTPSKRTGKTPAFNKNMTTFKLPKTPQQAKGISLFRIMVLGIDSESRNHYIQHWVDMKKNRGKLYQTETTRIRFMRVYTSQAEVNDELTLRLTLFDVIKPEEIANIPECDLIVMVLPFRYKSFGFRQRIEKFLRTIRLLVDGAIQETYKGKIFWQRTVILLEDEFHKSFKNKSLGTYVRERTQCSLEVTDLCTSIVGTKFSRHKKKNKIYLFESDTKHMTLKDKVDCRIVICNHVLMNVVSSWNKKEKYVTWLVKRHIPLPGDYIEKALEYCTENESINEAEADNLWNSLRKNQLLPKGGKYAGYELVHMACSQELVLDKLTAKQKLREQQEFQMEHIMFGVDPNDVEKQFAMETKSYSVEQENKQDEFKSDTLSFELVKSEIDKTVEFEDQRAETEQLKVMDDQFESQQIEHVLGQDSERPNSATFEAETWSVDVKKTMDQEFQEEQTQFEQKTDDSLINKTKLFEQSKTAIDVETEEKSVHFSPSHTSITVEKEMGVNFEDQRSSVVIKDDERPKETEFEEEELKMEQKQDALQNGKQKSKNYKDEQYTLEQLPEANESDSESDSPDAKRKKKRGRKNKNKDDDEYYSDSDADDEPDNEFELDRLEMEAFMKFANSPMNVDAIIDLGFHHPQQLKSKSAKQKRDIADKLGFKKFKKTGFMKACKKYKPKTKPVPFGTGRTSSPRKRKPKSVGKRDKNQKHYQKDSRSNDFITKKKKKHRATNSEDSRLGTKTYNEDSNSESYSSDSDRKSKRRKRKPRRKHRKNKNRSGDDDDDDEVNLEKRPSILDRGANLIATLKQKATPSASDEREKYQDQMSKMVNSKNRRKYSVSQSSVQLIQTPVPFGKTFIGGVREKKTLHSLKDRFHLSVDLERMIRQSLSQLDESTVNTKQQIEDTINRIIRALQQAKNHTLSQCDLFAHSIRERLITQSAEVSDIRDHVNKGHDKSKQMLYVKDGDDKHKVLTAKEKFRSYTSSVLKNTILDEDIPNVQLNVRFGDEMIGIPKMIIEGTTGDDYIDGNLNWDWKQLHQMFSFQGKGHAPIEMEQQLSISVLGEITDYDNQDEPEEESESEEEQPEEEEEESEEKQEEKKEEEEEQLQIPAKPKEPEIVYKLKWKRDFYGNSKHTTWYGNNRFKTSGQGLYVLDVEVTPENNKLFWEIQVIREPQLFWVGFMKGPIDEIEWGLGEFPPVDGFGCENENGLWYIGTKYSGRGCGRYIHNRDRLDFELDVVQGRCKGDINNRHMNRYFHFGELPNNCVPAILAFSGAGEFAVYATDEKCLMSTQAHV